MKFISGVVLVLISLTGVYQSHLELPYSKNSSSYTCDSSLIRSPQWATKPFLQINPVSQGFSQEGLDYIESLLQKYVDQRKIAGAIAFIARRGEIVYYKPTGFDDLDQQKKLEKDAIFRIASQTKAITSVAVMQLYEEKLLDLMDPISKYLPEFGYPQIVDTFDGKDSSYQTRPSKREITIFDLLTHTSGYTYPGNGGEAGNAIYAKAGIIGGVPVKCSTLKNEMLKISRLPLIHEPGEKFTYGISTDILGYLVEVLSGQSLETYFRNRIFDPLEMKDTYFYLPPEKHRRLMTLYETDHQLEGLKSYTGPESDFPKKEGIYYSGGGGLSSTAMDYRHFMQMLLDEGIYKGTRLLKPETIRMMRSNQIGQLGSGSLFIPSTDKFGLGFEVIMPSENDASLITRGSYGWGGAFGSLYWIDPANELIVLLVIQKTGDYNDLRSDFIKSVYLALQKESLESK